MAVQVVIQKKKKTMMKMLKNLSRLDSNPVFVHEIILHDTQYSIDGQNFHLLQVH